MSNFKKIFYVEDGFKVFWTVGDFIRCKHSYGLTLRSSNFKVNMLLDSEWYIEIQIDNRFNIYLFKSHGLSFNSNVDLSMYLLTRKGWVIKEDNRFENFQSGSGFGSGLDGLKWNQLLDGTLTVCFHLWNGSTRGQTAQCFMTSKMINESEILHSPFQKFNSLTPSDLENYPYFDLSASLPKTISLPNFHTVKAREVELTDKTIQTDATEDNNDFNDLEDLLRLYKEKKFRYVILRTGDKEFATHKALLCARSPVFNAMFSGNMKENKSNTVDIEDIDGDTLSLFCNFLHLEPLEDLNWDSAVKLFYTADKYQVEHLKKKCILNMIKELTEENICDTFILADMYQEKELMQSAFEYFIKNSKRIISLSEWKYLTLTRAELVSEVLCKMAERLDSLCA